MDVTTLLLIALAVATLAFIAVIAFGGPSRQAAARRFAWMSFLIPLFFSTQQTAESIQNSSVGPADAVRAGVPLLALVILLVFTKRQGHWFGVAEGFLLAFSFWICLSFSWSISSRETILKGILQVIYYLLVMALVRTYRGWPELVNALVAFCHALMLSVILSLAIDPSGTYRTAFDGLTRLTGQYPPIEPNILGLIATVVILALALRVGPRWTLGWPRIPLLLIYLTEVILSRSRLAMVVGAVIVIVALTREAMKTGMRLLLAILAALTGLAALLWKWDTIFAFLTNGQSADEIGTLTGRTVLWDRAIQAWSTNPILGLGYYSGHRFGIKFVPGPVEQSTLDNVWVETLLDVGVIGCALLAGFAVFGLIRVFRATRYSHSPAGTVARATAVLGLISTSFSPSIQGTNLASVLFCTVLLGVAERVEDGPVDYWSTPPDLIHARRVAARTETRVMVKTKATPKAARASKVSRRG